MAQSPQGRDTADETTSDASSDSEIIVMAQRRPERSQDVPISLTSLSQESLERSSINNILDLVKVTPSFTAYRSTQAANTRLAIRGIGTAGNSAIEPSVGAFVDGVYIARPGPLLAGLNDIASVEILRGPQGTLFGRNASVGAISFNTNKPVDYFTGDASMAVGTDGYVRATALINTPLGERAAFRVSGVYSDFGGYGTNLIDGSSVGDLRTVSVRAALLLNLGDNLEWTIRADYQHQKGDGAAPQSVVAETVTPTFAANFNRVLNGAVPRLDNTYSFKMRQVTAGRLDDEQYGVVSDLAYSIGEHTLRLISSYRKWDDRQTDENAALTPTPLLGRDSAYVSKSHSQELQFTSDPTRRLSATTGLYFFAEDYRIGVDNAWFGPDFCNALIRNGRPASLAGCLAGPQNRVAYSNFDQNTRSLAAYGQATFKILPGWDLVGGLRYSHDRKRADYVTQAFNPVAALVYANDSASLAFDGGKATYRLGTVVRPAKDIMVFATYSTGYKSGGFDASSASALGANRVFRPELTTNYEMGVRTQWFDRKLTANATLFRMDIDDFQLRSFNGVGFSVVNAGSIRQQGVEFEVNARPVEGLTFGVAGTYLDGKYTDFRNAPPLPGLTGTQDLTGTRTSFSPRWQGAFTTDWKVPLSDSLTANLSANLSYTSQIDVGGTGSPQGLQDGYALLGLRLALYQSEDDGWQLSLNADNVTDQRYCTLKFAQTFGGLLGVVGGGNSVQRCVLGDPRSLKASVRYRF